MARRARKTGKNGGSGGPGSESPNPSSGAVGSPGRPALPEFVEPMLARSLDAPFDSPEYLFEVKWDGTRCIAFVERDRLRLQNRRRVEMRLRYPEMHVLSQLPPGSVIDGEIVVLEDGKPSFTRLMQREHLVDPQRIAMVGQRLPATYMAFDLLYDGGANVMSRPVIERRERLAALIAELRDPHVIVPEHTLEHGTRYFQAVTQHGLEGIIAKRIDSAYAPGKRTSDWLKIKAAQEAVFDVIGYVQREGEAVVSALVLGMRQGNRWIDKGRVGSGFTEPMRAAFYQRLSQAPPLARPPKDGPKEAVWCESGLRARVQFFEKTVTGKLRGPVFKGLAEEAESDPS